MLGKQFVSGRQGEVKNTSKFDMKKQKDVAPLAIGQFRRDLTRQVVFTLVTRGRFFLTSASKFNIETNGTIFDVSRENDRASPNVKTPLEAGSLMTQTL